MATTKIKRTTEELHALQCNECPLACFKGTDAWWPDDTQVDVLIVTPKGVAPLGRVLPYKTVTKQVSLIECAKQGDKINKTAMACCLGRKLDDITKHKPKLVISVGYDAFKAIELACGHSPEGITDFFLLPTEFKGHKFWHMGVPDYDTHGLLSQNRELVERALSTIPEIHVGDHAGVEYVTDNQSIDEAFDWLEQQLVVAFDLETRGVRPYLSTSNILSIAIGTNDRTIVFPLEHPETPESFDTDKVFARLWELAKKVPMVAHNLVFELEWLDWWYKKKLTGYEGAFSYIGQFHDTMVQAAMLSTVLPKDLDSLIRRYFGFSLKVLSNVDVKDLWNTPLEQVLAYNSLDTKYTYPLFLLLLDAVSREDQDAVYDIQVNRVPATVLMQQAGLPVDLDFVVTECAATQKEYTDAENEFLLLPEVMDFQELKRDEIRDQIAALDAKIAEIPDGKRQKTKQKYLEKKQELLNLIPGNHCNPASDDLDLLLKRFCGVPDSQDSLNEEFLSTLDHPVASLVLRMRKASKIYSTYLLPYNTTEPDGGKHVFPDGMVRPRFNALGARTFRYSSSEPNGQNYPSRGGKKRLRSVIKAPKGKKMAALDQAQIEYRMIATISEDEEMIHAINNDHDVHMYWAQQIAPLYPQLVQDPSDPAQMQEFRSTVKNSWTFPMCYGSSMKSIAANFGITNPNKLYSLGDEFWDHHHGVKRWHERLKKEMKEKGYITNPFGRKFRGPLSYNKLINYGIQSTASDVVVESMVKLARLSVELDLPDLAPVLLIHDDLSFFIDEELLEELLPIIIEIMIDARRYKSWLHVPLEVELAIGDSWGALKKVGAFNNKDWNFTMSA